MGRASGAQAQDGGLSIVIEWPNEGETLYAGPTSLLYKVPIKGRVSSDQYEADEIVVELVVSRGGTQIGTLTTTPDEDGYFELYVTVNPDGPTEQFEIAFVECGIACHSPAEVDLQPGHLQLRVTASDPAGNQAVAERSIVVDISGMATIPVYVSLAGEDDRPVSDIDVAASTRLYLWRSRFGAGRSDASGLADVQVEALGQSPTTYVLKIDPTIVNGVLYEGIEPVEVILEPGAIEHGPIEMEVRARQGQISGQLSLTDDQPLAGISVWAIQLPEGSSRQAVTDSHGEFVFSEVPLERYLIALDDNKLGQEGFAAASEEVDLADVTQAAVEIALDREQGNRLSGRVVDEHGEPLPFGWAMVEGASGWQAVLPGSGGRFTISGLPDQAAKVVVSAPGYYGRVLVANPESTEPVDLALARQEGTSDWPWGEGRIVVPAGARVREQNERVILDQGWLWGQNADSAEAILQIDSAEVVLNGGEFAVAHSPGQFAWLYVLDGTAEIVRNDLSQPIVANEGQMVNLLNERGLTAVALDPIVMATLASSQHDEVPLAWQPSLSARIRDRLAWLGVSTAQVVTFVTYFLLILSLIFLPLIGINWWWRRRKYAAQPEP
jgi:hypothetical protein